jgi:hypothetical protein
VRPVLNRRSFFGAALAGCAGGCILKPRNQFLWGSTQRFAFANANALTPAYFGIAGPQLVNVEVDIPQTWSFLVHVKTLRITPGATQQILLRWDVVAGLGRSQVTIRGFLSFTIDPTIVDPLTGLPPDQWCVEGNLAAQTTTSTNTVKTIPARTIIVQPRAVAPVADPNITYDLEVSASVAPWTHG